MPFSLAGKTAVVTGAASGIGLQVATVFAKAGATVAILDLSGAAVDAAANTINSSGPSRPCAGYVCDVTDEAAVRACFANICAAHGRIDCLVNNAGISAVGDVLKATGAELDRVYAVNVKGVFHCLKAGVEKMLADGKGGAIVNLASIASLIGLADRFSYAATKGAVLTMTYSVATDYCRKGIRCNCVCPGRVHTPFVDGFLKKNYPGKEAEVFAKLAEEMTDVVFVKVDVDENAEVAEECGIQSMPTFQFYKSGEKVHEFSGASEDKIKEGIAQFK